MSDSQRKVGICEYDQRSFATELKVDAFHIICSSFLDMFACSCRSGETNFAYIRVIDKCFTSFVAVAWYRIKDTWDHTIDLVPQFNQLQSAQWCHFWNFVHTSAA